MDSYPNHIEYISETLKLYIGIGTYLFIFYFMPAQSLNDRHGSLSHGVKISRYRYSFLLGKDICIKAVDAADNISSILYVYMQTL